MAVHLRTYLHNRYGLSLLVHEYSEACLDGVRANEAADADVATFGCVLRHEVEEGFVGVQHQLKHTVQELLRVYLRGKLPLKTDHHIGELLQKRVNGLVKAEEWSDIVRYMYAPRALATVPALATARVHSSHCLACADSACYAGTRRTTRRCC